VENAQRQDAVGRTRVLIVTVTPLERIEHYLGQPLDPRYDGLVPVFTAGRPINGTEVFVVQAGAQGLSAPSGISTVTAAAIASTKPHYALITGICYGLKPAEQQLGDVLVSERTKDLDHAKLADIDDEVERQDRGEDVAPSPILLNSCQAAEQSWSRTSDVPVRFGQMLAWNKLLNAQIVVEELRHRYPWAIGGDMEGADFHAATVAAGVDSILVKAICDWVAEKTSNYQEIAARNAAEFVLHLVTAGALANEPARRRR
jgi:nucleoside phosphorylase